MRSCHSNVMQESDLWHTAWHCLAGPTRANTIPSNDTPVRWVLAVPCRKVTRDTLHVTVTTCQRSKKAGRRADTVIDGGGNKIIGNTTPQGLNFVVKAWLTTCYTSQLSLVRCFQVSLHAIINNTIMHHLFILFYLYPFLIDTRPSRKKVFNIYPLNGRCFVDIIYQSRENLILLHILDWVRLVLYDRERLQLYMLYPPDCTRYIIYIQLN